jgi:hypothetical protein
MPRRLALLACLLAAACSSSATPRALSTPGTTPQALSTPSLTPTTPPTPAATRATSPGAAASSCTTYAPADPHRPVVTAEVTVDGATVTGTERVVFTPDLPVSELVFRLWAAGPVPSRNGGSVTLSTVRVDGRAAPFSRPAATLVRVPHRGPAGQPTTIDLRFSVTLPHGANDRFGVKGSTSWFASGLPLLAWERGRGWATEPATTQFAEASTAEEMRLERLTVHHATGLKVISTGVVTSEDAATTVTSAPTVRDLAVAVGQFATVTLAGPVPVTVGVAPGLKDDPATIARELVRAMKVHIARFGPFPYQRLGVAVLPDIRGGIEYPGEILLGTAQDEDATVSHEVAHQWFYGLVGDDQARDPWLDEGFATYAEALDRGTGPRYLATTIPADGLHRAGRPMTYWEGRSGYYRSVYVQTAAALLRARARSPRTFDAQVRCYVARGAHQIATPADLRASIPLAVPALRAAGDL